MGRVWLNFFFIITIGSLSAQKLPDFSDSFVTNIIFQYDNRNERYYGVRARMNGLKLGVEIEEIFRVGVGFYGNNTFYPFEPPSAIQSLPQTVKFRYTTVFTEWVLYKDFRWEISLPLAYGGGMIQHNNFKLDGSQPEFLGRDTIRRNRLIDIGAMGHYKVFPWAGIGAGIGYRQLLQDDPTYRKPFSAPYFDIKLNLFLGYIYKGIFKPEEVEVEREEYEQKRAARKARR